MIKRIGPQANSDIARGTKFLPANVPKARVFGFLVSMLVDADHACDTTTTRSRTGYIAYVNSAPDYWMSKKQNSVEISSFGIE